MILVYMTMHHQQLCIAVPSLFFFVILRISCYLVLGYIACYHIISVSRGQPFYRECSSVAFALPIPSFRTPQATRPISDNSESSFSLLSHSYRCYEFHRPVRSMAYA